MAEGNIRKRGENRWQLTYDAPRGADGKRRQKYETFKGTKKQAQARLREILGSIDGKRYVDPSGASNETVSEFLDRSLRDYAEAHCKDTTVDGYRTIIRAHLQPAFGAMPLSTLTHRDIDAYYADKVRAGRKGRTVHHHHALLRKALAWAERKDDITVSPMHKVDAPKVEHSPAQSLEIEQVPQLLAAFENSPFYLPVHLALHTGLRKGEVLGLRWRDVDLRNQRITVNQTVNNVEGKPRVGTPKTKGSNRRLTITSQTALLLRAARERVEAYLAEAGGAFGPDLQVCAYPDGRQMTPNGLHQAFKRRLKDTPLSAFRFQDLRHTHASILLATGTPTKVVQERLGHSRPSTTMDVYAHVLGNAADGAAEDFERAVWADVGKMLAENGAE